MASVIDLSAIRYRHRVRERRLALGLNRSEVARRAGLTPEGVRRIEQGISWPLPSTRARLAEALECAESELFWAEIEAA